MSYEPEVTVAAAHAPARPMVLAVGDAGGATGYGRILDMVLNGLSPYCDVAQVAIGGSHEDEGSPWGVYQLVEQSPDRRNTQFYNIVLSVKPDVLIIIHDVAVLRLYEPALRALRGKPSLVLYTALEGPILYERLLRTVALLDVLVLSTRLYRKEIRRDLVRLAMNHKCPVICTIPVPVDTKVFAPDLSRDGIHGPLLGRDIVRKRVFGTDRFAGTFIVLNANRNHVRKRIDLTVEAFARFATADRGDAYLWLHMETVGHSGWDLRSLLRRFGVANRTICHLSFPSRSHASTAELVQIYNAADVGVNTSAVEGWGMISVEHAATGAAQIIPEHSSGPLIWPSGAIRARSARNLVAASAHEQESVVDVSDVVHHLDKLYEDRSHLEHMTRAALRRSRSARFGLEPFADAWLTIISSLRTVS